MSSSPSFADVQGAARRLEGVAVRTPLLERSDVLDRAQDDALGRAYRMFDDQGRVLVLRPDLTIPIARLIAELSAVITLYPGDLIFTGTPSGVGMARKPPRFLQPGNVLETRIEGIGRLRNRITAGAAS